jgi:hypothetical protein
LFIVRSVRLHAYFCIARVALHPKARLIAKLFDPTCLKPVGRQSRVLPGCIGFIAGTNSILSSFDGSDVIFAIGSSANPT